MGTTGKPSASYPFTITSDAKLQIRSQYTKFTSYYWPN